MGIKEMFGALFATGADIEEYSDAELNPQHKKTLDNIKQAETEVETPISENKQTKAKSGLRKKYETPEINSVDEKSSQENLERMTKILKGKKAEEKEIGE